MWLGSGVADGGCPAGGNRGHNDILRGGDRGLIQQDGGADAPEQLRVQVGRPDSARHNPPGTTPQVFDPHPQAGDHFPHNVHVTYIGNIVQDDWFLRHERGRHDGQGNK